uniref:Rho-GAP domain-containing protein n=1 Tax=Meloidogyne incognita TaxID=6306 RepID=A0A914KGF9_MELIC
MNLFSKKSKKGTTATTTNELFKIGGIQLFKLPLVQAVKNNPSFDGVPVPALIRECLDYIAFYGLDLEGIFRVSSPKSRLDELELMANSEKRDEIVFQDAHEAAGLLKRFLHHLPENMASLNQHILTQQLKPKFEQIASECKCNYQNVCACQCALQLKKLLLQLPTENYYLLGYIFRHAHLIIQHESSNKMGLPAIGVLLHLMFNLSQPLVKTFLLNSISTNVFENNNNNSSEGNEQQKTIITTTALFDVVDFKPYVKPKSIEELRLEMPTTSKQIEEEILKQQNLLEYLHEHIQQMRQHSNQQVLLKQKEDEMWAVQTGITVLKRKLKNLAEVEEGVPKEVCSKGEKREEEIEEKNIFCEEDEEEIDETNAKLLEKQLIASKLSLSNEIGDEKKAIVRLLSELRELRNKLPESEQNLLTESQKATNNLSQQRPLKYNNNNKQHVGSQTNKEQRNGEKDDTDWEQLCAEEERKNAELLAELIRYRRICSQLRSRLEYVTLLVNFEKNNQHPTKLINNFENNSSTSQTEDSANLLITRF